jgi:hypothetical protein
MSKYEVDRRYYRSIVFDNGSEGIATTLFPRSETTYAARARAAAMERACIIRSSARPAPYKFSYVLPGGTVFDREIDCF